MYPHPELNSFLQGFEARMPKKVLNRAVDKAMHERTTWSQIKSPFPRLASTQPACFAPHVDVTRAKCAYGSYAIPKLKEELHSEDPLTVRQAVTTLGDLLVDPEKLIEAVDLNIVDRLTDLLVSTDPYLRERVAAIFATIANQATGKQSILQNLPAIANLSKGLKDDPLAAVRLKIALAMETLARDYCAADMLCACGLLESVTAKLGSERRDILVVHLETLKFLLHRDVKARRAIEAGTFDELTTLLSRKDEEVLRGALSCLGVLCEDGEGKKKAIETDLLSSLKVFIEDDRESLKAEACRVASFITATTPGKLRALELGLDSSLLRLIATDECHCCSCNGATATLLAIMKTLTNVAEAPRGRATLLSNIRLIEDIDVGESEVLHRHKQILQDVIRWKA